MSEPLRAGRIVYTNDLPIYAAYDAKALTFPGSLQSEVPARLNALMRAGDLDLSPMSAFEYLENADTYALLPDLCIGSRDAVWSVLAVSQVPLHELDQQEIYVTAESASGRNLLRVLLERYYGVEGAQFIVVDDPLSAAKDGKPALLIGDTAIAARESIAEEWLHDLGRIWHYWTGLDMVYAVWGVRREVLAERSEDVREALCSLLNARSWGAANLPTVVAMAQQTIARKPGFYEAYYATLNYVFDDRAHEGLARFAKELAAIKAIPAKPNLVPEVFSCQSVA
jgi:chorismate dehydratase